MYSLPTDDGSVGQLVGLWRVHRHGLGVADRTSAGSTLLSAGDSLCDVALLREPLVGGAVEQLRFGTLRSLHGHAAL